MTLQGRNIVLGVTGSIASYKGADLASKLTQAGALVDVIMTRSAMEFVTPLTFSSLTHRTVVRDLFDADSETSVEHVMLAKRADAVIIAPATANVIAKIVHGLADDMLTATVLATAAPSDRGPGHGRQHVRQSRHPTEPGDPPRARGRHRRPAHGLLGQRA